MKKKQRCFFKRLAALVAALLLCLSLCVPCFASNNAASRKWVVRSEAQMTTESGSLGRYLELVPYENGAVYATPITTSYSSIILKPSSIATESFNNWALFLNPINYPDWWRSSIPLGANAYISFSKARLLSSTVDNSNISPSTSSFSVYAFTPSLGVSVTAPYSQGGDKQYFLSGPAVFYPVDIYYDTSSSVSSSGGGSFSLPHHDIFYGSTATYLLQDFSQFCFSTSSLFRNSDSFLTSPSGLSLSSFYPHYNASSDSLVFAVMPSNISPTSSFSGVLSVSVEISFFVYADKLPAGLQVGDEFPADTDAFDQLRDDLIKQFPEASENIENGKATIQGWNDTETVDTDVASTSISALDAMFQNLGGFLFIISLMIFGAVVLRMLIRKAVDG